MTAGIKLTYLGKDGKTFGPYTEADLDKLNETGEIYEYTWIWESAESGWQPIQAPPPPPPAEPSPTLSAHLPPQFQHAGAVSTPEHFQVICHDKQNLISAQFSELSSSGGKLISRDFSDSLPPFIKGETIWLNILDARSQKTEKVGAKVLGFYRAGGHWEYEILWSSPSQKPKIIDN